MKLKVLTTFSIGLAYAAGVLTGLSIPIFLARRVVSKARKILALSQNGRTTKSSLRYLIQSEITGKNCPSSVYSYADRSRRIRAIINATYFVAIDIKGKIRAVDNDIQYISLHFNR